jgi:hypothetical protein
VDREPVRPARRTAADKLARLPAPALRPDHAAAAAPCGPAVKTAEAPGGPGTDPLRLPANRPPATRPIQRTPCGRQSLWVAALPAAPTAAAPAPGCVPSRRRRWRGKIMALATAPRSTRAPPGTRNHEGRVGGPPARPGVSAAPVPTSHTHRDQRDYQRQSQRAQATVRPRLRTMLAQRSLRPVRS